MEKIEILKIGHFRIQFSIQHKINKKRTVFYLDALILIGAIFTISILLISIL